MKVLSKTISRVMSLDGHLSRHTVANMLQRPTRKQTGRLMLSVRSCFGWGLHMPRLLPVGRQSLALPFHPYRIAAAVYFCCTVLRVASTRRYLASCPVKPGLSSPMTFRFHGSDHLSYSKHWYHIIFFLSCPERILRRILIFRPVNNLVNCINRHKCLWICL